MGHVVYKCCSTSVGWTGSSFLQPGGYTLLPRLMAALNLTKWKSIFQRTLLWVPAEQKWNSAPLHLTFSPKLKSLSCDKMKSACEIFLFLFHPFLLSSAFAPSFLSSLWSLSQSVSFYPSCLLLSFSPNFYYIFSSFSVYYNPFCVFLPFLSFIFHHTFSSLSVNPCFLSFLFFLTFVFLSLLSHPSLLLSNTQTLFSVLTCPLYFHFPSFSPSNFLPSAILSLHPSAFPSLFLCSCLFPSVHLSHLAPSLSRHR